MGRALWVNRERPLGFLLRRGYEGQWVFKLITNHFGGCRFATATTGVPSEEEEA